MVNELGKRLLISRINAGYSRKQVSELIGMTPSTIGLYETDLRQPSLSSLVKFAHLYGVSTDYLLGTDIPIKGSIPLDGLTDEQVSVLRTVYKAFRNQIHQ